MNRHHPDGYETKPLMMFDALCEANAVQGNPVDSVKRPKVASQEGSTPAIGDHQARALLGARWLDPQGPA